MKERKYIFCILVVVLFVISIIFGVNMVEDKNDMQSDALLFKTEYESLNNTKRENSDKIIRSISIPEDNPFLYKDAGEIIDLIEHDESFIVYFGFSDCPWCRSVLPTFIEVAEEYDLDEVYYVDIKNIRDVIELNSQNKLITTKKGSDDYYRLLEAFNNVLEDYEVNNSNNESVYTGEKRMYAPSFIVVIDGEAQALTTGISDLQNDGYMELSDEIKSDMYQKIEKLISIMKPKQDYCSIQKAC